MQNRSQTLQNQILQVGVYRQAVHGMHHFFILSQITATFHFHTARLREIIKLVHGLERKIFLHFLVGAGQEHVENVVVSLHGSLLHDATLFQQIGLHIAAFDVVLLVTVDFHILAKPTAVVVAHRLRVTKALQQRVGIQNLILNTGSDATRCAAADGRDELQNLLRGLGLASAGLALIVPKLKERCQ